MLKVYAAVAAALLFAVAAGPAPAQENASPAVLAGMALYKSETGDCKNCHGWNGTGRNNDHPWVSDIEAIGPALSTSTMSREEMIMVISCGKHVDMLNTTMPQFRGDAWTPAYPCWGRTTELPDDQRPARAPIMIAPSAIENVVAYIQEAYQGKRMSWDWCSKYFDDFQRICEVWRDYGAQ